MPPGPNDPTPLHLWLVRHGESMGNVDLDVHRTHADHAIDLSERGRQQAREAGAALARIFDERGLGPDAPDRPHVRLWTSPYARTRQTADGLMEALGDRITDRREDIRLCEQQFGLFDGIPDEELPERYPVEYSHYRKHERFEGRFWARMPLGESRFDVANRIHAFLGTLARDRDRHGIHHAVIVCHGVTLRALVMQRLHLSPEWFEAAKNPRNCAVRYLEGKEDRGYVFAGFG